MKQAAIGSLLLLVALGLCSCLTAGGEEHQQEYAFSSHAEEVVISVLTSGGSSRYIYETSVYGDGRLVKTVRQGSVIRSQQEGQLEYVEIDDLIRGAVEGDLMEWEPESFDKKVRDSLGGERPTPASDVSMQQLTIRLEEYRNREGIVTSPAEIRIDTPPPRFLKASNPGLDVKEVDALVALCDGLAAFPALS